LINVLEFVQSFSLVFSRCYVLDSKGIWLLKNLFQPFPGGDLALTEVTVEN